MDKLQDYVKEGAPSPEENTTHALSRVMLEYKLSKLTTTQTTLKRVDLEMRTCGVQRDQTDKLSLFCFRGNFS